MTTRRVLMLAMPLLLGAAAPEAGIAIDNFTFAPATLTVRAGTNVRWTNRDDIPHLVVATDGPAPFRSRALDTADGFAQRLAKPGTYRYFCALHPMMQGTIVVR